MEKTFEETLQDYQQRIKSTTIFSTIISQLVESPHSEAWKLLDQCIQFMKKTNLREIERILQTFSIYSRKINTFTMLIYLYSLKEKRKIYMSYIGWKRIYQEIGIDQNQLLIFNSWISSSPENKIIQQSLQMVAIYFPIFFKNQYLMLSESELTSVIYWLAFLKTQQPKKYNIACDLAKVVKENRLLTFQDSLQKQHLILKKLIQVLGESQDRSSGNAFLLLYPLMLRQKDINYFCHIEGYFLTNLSQNHLCNVFAGLTKSTITKEILYIIDKICRMLQIQDEKLYCLLLLKRAKNCLKIQDFVYEIGRFFIIGFLKHCDIGPRGLQCILKNINQISQKQLRDKWIQICSTIIIKHPEYKNSVLQQLKKQNLIKTNQSMQLKNSTLKMTQIWNVTIRNGKKHKIYPKEKSRIYKGIQNQSNQCYMISIVQSLYMTGSLGNFINKNKSLFNNKHDFPLLNQLSILFRELEGKKSTDRIIVNYLQKKGPDIFMVSQRQQDAQDYLIRLFQSIQNSLENHQNILKQFQQLFKIQVISKIICQCGKISQRKQYQYAFTISHNQVLKKQSQQTLTDYNCDKCFKKNAKLFRIINPKCEILTVHINRFDHSGGRTKKLLSNQTILRNFINYELIGMLCHIGKNVEHGHYIYYAKINKTRWAQMNDIYVEQFNIDDEKQQFERQMKAQMTPYIIFYKKIANI